MALLTATEDYVIAALQTATFERLDDGSVGATVPSCPGVIAFGADVRECLIELYARLDDDVRVGIARGWELPLINGVSPSTTEGHVPSVRSDDASHTSENDFSDNEDELEAAFQRRSRPT